MKKNEAIAWLNRRKDLCNKKAALLFEQEDLNFIRVYIHHYKKKLVPFEQIVASLQHCHPQNLIMKVDHMITKLMFDFKIETKTEQKEIQDIQFNLQNGYHPLQMVKADFITEYY